MFGKIIHKMNEIITFFKSFIENSMNPYILYVIIPTILVIILSHLTLGISFIQSVVNPDVSFLTILNNYNLQGGILTTATSVIITSLITFFFNPLKDNNNFLTIKGVLSTFFILVLIVICIINYLEILRSTPDKLKDLNTTLFSVISIFVSLFIVYFINHVNVTNDAAKQHLQRNRQAQARLRNSKNSKEGKFSND